MRAVMVFNHPYEGSYGNALLQSVTMGLQKAGHEVDLMHLDKDEFNPRMTGEDLKAFVAHQPVDTQVMTIAADYSMPIILFLFFRFGGTLCRQLPRGLLTGFYFQG